ncbi:hypothetical protein UVI_02010810 [Ustilaginoidea virens]|uniref:Pierisin-like domain-containing protein n=1 Tax=Ustilaginoidea virens TaxID=1159556 RepID=A0A1B5KZG4_USTVR|nr:hypothetical protein UVI_02010810 [Ustilaginoidea virens]
MRPLQALALLLASASMAFAKPARPAKPSQTPEPVWSHDVNTHVFDWRLLPSEDTEKALFKRNKPDGIHDGVPATRVAVDNNRGTRGVFYRGTNAPPSVVFQQGFIPTGNIMDIQNHLSYRGGSGYIALTIRTATADTYAYGRTGSRTPIGYVYVVRAMGLNDGYFFPPMYPNDHIVQANQEFGHPGPIAAGFILGAYELNGTGNRRWIANPNYQPPPNPNPGPGAGPGTAGGGLCVISRKRSDCDPWNNAEDTPLRRICPRFKSLEVQVQLSDEWFAGTWDTIGYDVGPTDHTQHYDLMAAPQKGAKGTSKVDLVKVFGTDTIDIQQGLYLTLTVQGVMGAHPNNDQFKIQTISIVGQCEDGNYTAGTEWTLNEWVRHPAKGEGTFAPYKLERFGKQYTNYAPNMTSTLCPVITGVNYDFYVGSDLFGAGTDDKVGFSMGLNSEVFLGQSFYRNYKSAGDVDMRKVFGMDKVPLANINALLFYQTGTAKDQWKIGGMPDPCITLEATCESGQKLRMTKYQKIDVWSENPDGANVVYGGEVDPSMWRIL